MVSTCVILSGMTNVLCLLYVGWITNYVSNNENVKVAGRTHEKKFDEDNRGETLRIIERLDRLESVVNQHIQGNVILFLYDSVWCVTVVRPSPFTFAVMLFIAVTVTRSRHEHQ